jgi:DNA recombination protein RmuC
MDVPFLFAGLVLGALVVWFAQRQQLRHTAAELTSARERILDLTARLSRSESESLHLQEKLAEHKKEVEELHHRLTEEFSGIANQVLVENSRHLQEQHRGSLDALLSPLKDQIVRFEQKVDQTHKESIRDSASLKAQLTSLQQLNQSIGVEAHNLTTALKGQSKTQGNWGEMVLERILEDSGLQKGREYALQVSQTTTEGRQLQPDVVIQLPEGRTLVVDAKVSLTAYERWCVNENEEEREKALKEHVGSLRRHFRELGDKNYHDLYQMQSPDFVLMFVPIEPAFVLAMREDPMLHKDALAKNVVMVSQSTLMATLRTIASIWRREDQNRNAAEIAKKGGELYDKFAALLDSLKDVARKIDGAGKGLDDTLQRLATGRGNIINRIQELKRLGARTKQALPADLVEEADRHEDEEADEKNPT